MKAKNKKTLLKGEGANQHTLYGNFTANDNEFADVIVKQESHLKHEQPNGEFAEHKGLMIEKGDWIMGKQVEYNPFTNEVTRVWD